MAGQYIFDYLPVFFSAILATALVFTLFTVASIVAPRQRSQAKDTVYECGMLPIGQLWTQVHVRYYIFAILFMIFEVEVVFLFPWAVILGSMGSVPGLQMAAFVEMLIFIAILIFGLAYAWKKGVLEWK